MHEPGTSPDGLWRWDGQQWVANAPDEPPASRGDSTFANLRLAGFAAAGLALAITLVQIIGDTAWALWDVGSASDRWYYSYWLVFPQFLLAVAALTISIVIRKSAQASMTLLALASVAVCQGLATTYSQTVAHRFDGSLFAYCAQLDDARRDLESLDVTALTDDAYDRLLSRFEDLAAIAPDDVADDWSTLVDALAQFRSILNEAGISFDDLRGLASGQIPSGVDPAEMENLASELQDFTANSDFSSSSEAISAHARDECGLDLSA